VINVLATYSDRSGCGDYRVRFPVAAVNAAEELDIYAEAVDHFDGDATFADGRYNIRSVFLPSGVSVVSVQRPMAAAMAGALRWLKERRPDVGLVVELDDDLGALPVANEAHGQLRDNPLENPKWFAQALACADVLTVSSPELARLYSRPGRPTFIVRNGVPGSMLSHPARSISRSMRNGGSSVVGDRIIGWAGNVGTHPGDLEVTCGALADFVGSPFPPNRTVRFRNVGPRDGVAKGLGLAEEDVEASGWLSPELYRVALGELDIGIVPLADNRFNRCKSALKALEMAAAGVPVIASRLPEFEALQLSGMPIWLADARRRHWCGALHRALALTDGELREMAQASREYVRRFATVEVRAPEWANAWRTAAQIARSRTNAGRRTESVR
jgi:glycosyltransferase involved in cell wall biosynthesis